MAAETPDNPIDPNGVLNSYASSIGKSVPGEMPDALRKARKEAINRQKQGDNNPEGSDSTPKE